MRPSLIVSGIQFTERFAAIRRSLTAVTLINQLGTGVINERRIAAPAEGIAVYDFLRFEKETPSFKILYDQRIGGLRGHSREKIAARREFSLLVNELYDGKIILPPYAIVVLAESGRGVDDAVPSESVT